ARPQFGGGAPRFCVGDLHHRDRGWGRGAAHHRRPGRPVRVAHRDALPLRDARLHPEHRSLGAAAGHESDGRPPEKAGGHLTVGYVQDSVAGAAWDFVVIVSRPWAWGPVSARRSRNANRTAEMPRTEKIHMPGMYPSGFASPAAARSFVRPISQVMPATPICWTSVITA